MKDFLEIIKSGLLGYAAFFSTLIIAKLLASLLGTLYFRVEIGDLTLCIIGFVLAALIRLLEMFRQKKEVQTSQGQR